MTQGFWKVYKSKVLQSLGSEVQEEEFKDEGDNPELVETTDAPVLMEEGSNPISQLARRVQGAGARGWRSMSSLFSREDEHKLLTPEPCADHPLALKPAESPPAGKTTSGFWDVFASKWQQASALDKKTAQPEFSEPAAEFSGAPGEPLGEEPTYSNNGSDLQEPEEGAFKWGFLVSKLAEIGNKNAPKGN
ncbi:uncharacterized protein C1orf232 homolog [Chelonoidis abingdonii]|uniref:uncharacterized protein C1orf232 homolog n=1 Tax=Chelonoidis abingdonii TaxID=106734 RepID=UPI0013F1F3E2|nr:uncharacterized protein C1orf232 homolog [Chelonoidis abingdonii]